MNIYVTTNLRTPKGARKQYGMDFPSDSTILFNLDIIEFLVICDFQKETDNGKLNSCIKNLPKNETFYWFVGNQAGRMCFTVL